MVTPFFSIIIPIYNKELYIKKCVDSITAQTFGDFEVIIINDGSTDNSEHILNSISDSRFKIVSISNGGVSNARNVGLNYASGQYILFIDADDYIDDNYCESIRKSILEYDSELLIFGLKKIYDTNNVKYITPSTSGIIKDKLFRDTFLTEFDRLEGIYGYICNKAVRRDIITKNNIAFDISLKLAEDLDFWLLIYSTTPKIGISQYCGYNYIQDTPGSSSYYEFDPISSLKVWLNVYRYLSPCNTVNIQILQKKIWGIFKAALLECKTVSLSDIDKIINLALNLRKEYDFIDSYNPTDYLCSQIQRNNKLNIYLYLKARWMYHKLCLWLR